MGAPGARARGQQADPHCPPPPRRAGAPALGAPGWPHSPLHRATASPRTRSDPRRPGARARPPPGWRESGPRLVARTRPVRRLLRVLAAGVLSPSSRWPRLCVHRLPCPTRPWGRAAGEGPHPCIRLHDTGRAHPARLKRAVHFQGSAGFVVSTCHDGLLPPVARASQGAPPGAGVPQETRPHSRGAVVCVACSSKTLHRVAQPPHRGQNDGGHRQGRAPRPDASHLPQTSSCQRSHGIETASRSSWAPSPARGVLPGLSRRQGHCAPRYAALHPCPSHERCAGRPLGHPMHRKANAGGDKRMSAKREGSADADGPVLQGPHAKAPAPRPAPPSPAVARHPPRHRVSWRCCQDRGVRLVRAVPFA